MDPNFKDPYQAADDDAAAAKILTPKTQSKNTRWVVVSMVAIGLIVGVIILSNVAGMLTPAKADANTAAAKPVTMDKAQGDTFAQSQAAQATFMQGQDKDKAQQHKEDTITGNGTDLAGAAANTADSDPCAEAPGVPPMTPAQRQAAGCGGAGGKQPTTARPKTDAEVRREKAQLEAEHRRQNDIDSSPVALDFSDYFEKKESPAPGERRSCSA